MLASMIWEKTSTQFEVKGLGAETCDDADGGWAPEWPGPAKLGSDGNSGSESNLQAFCNDGAPGSLGQHESGSRFLLLGLGL